MANFYHGFPVARSLTVVVPRSGRRGMVTGRALSAGGATVLVAIGEHATVDDLYGEWIMVHELLHLGQPFTPEAWWLTEGMATYIEPLLRARKGWRSPGSVWRDFHRDMHRGRAALDRGLLNGSGNAYWSGALFMFLADMEIRRYSRGRRGIEDCLRAILRDGGDATVRWSAERSVASCDTLLGKPILGDMLERYGRKG